MRGLCCVVSTGGCGSWLYLPCSIFLSRYCRRDLCLCLAGQSKAGRVLHAGKSVPFVYMLLQTRDGGRFFSRVWTALGRRSSMCGSIWPVHPGGLTYMRTEVVSGQRRRRPQPDLCRSRVTLRAVSSFEKHSPELFFLLSPQVLFMFERLCWTYQLLMRVLEDLPQVLLSILFLINQGKDTYVSHPPEQKTAVLSARKPSTSILFAREGGGAKAVGNLSVCLVFFAAGLCEMPPRHLGLLVSVFSRS